MNANISSKTLAKLVAFGRKVVPPATRKNADHWHQFVRLSSDTGVGLSVAFVNGLDYAEANVMPGVPVGKGEALVRFTDLLAAVGKCQSIAVVSLDADAKRLDVTVGGVKSRLALGEVEFPIRPKLAGPSVKSAKLPPAAFRRALDYALLAASRDDTREYVSSVWFDDGVSATDGHRAHMTTFDGAHKNLGASKAVGIRTTSAEVWSAAVSLRATTLCLASGEREGRPYAALACDHGDGLVVKVWSRANEETQRPPLEQVTPKLESLRVAFRLDTKLAGEVFAKIASIRDEANKVSRERCARVRVPGLSGESGEPPTSATVSSVGPGGQYEVEVPITSTAEAELNAAFNSHYLCDALAVGSRTVALGSEGSKLDPIRLDGETEVGEEVLTHVALVMPVRI